MAELTHIFDHLPALQSFTADPNLLQNKFVRLSNVFQYFRFVNFSISNILEKTRRIQGGFGENTRDTERDEHKRIRE